MTRPNDGRTEELDRWRARFRSLIGEFRLLQSDLAEKCQSTDRHVNRALAGKGAAGSFYATLSQAALKLLMERRSVPAKALGLGDRLGEAPDAFGAAIEALGQPVNVNKSIQIVEATRINDGCRRAIALVADLQASLAADLAKSSSPGRDAVDAVGPAAKPSIGPEATPLTEEAPERRADEVVPATSTGPMATPAAQPAAAEPATRRWNTWMLFAAVVVFGTIIVVTWAVRARPIPPRLTVRAASVVRTHLGEVSGDCAAGEVDQRIRLYVGPDDGKHTYWLQNARDAVCDPAGGSIAPVRLGNERFEMAQDPPLYFTIFAVLVPASAAAALPGTPAAPRVAFRDDREFQARLASLGAQTIASVRVLRLAKEECDDVPVLVSPPPGEARAELASPVRLEWTPAVPRWVELRTRGEEVAGRSGRVLTSGTTINLEPGTFELKLRPRRESACSTDVWFDVKPSGGARPPGR